MIDDNASLELNGEQREVLLRGLRFARSALALDIHDPDSGDEERWRQLAIIDSLASQLEGNVAVVPTVEVS